MWDSQVPAASPGRFRYIALMRDASLVRSPIVPGPLARDRGITIMGYRNSEDRVLLFIPPWLPLQNTRSSIWTRSDQMKDKLRLHAHV